jgi:dipeptidyl aminopeptidase/acylaminoacyl peptidase
VLINGEMRGRTPLTVRELEPGEYEVVLHKDGFQDAQIITTVLPRQIVPVNNALAAARPPVTHRLAFFSSRDGAFDIWTTDEFGGNAARWTSLRWPRAPLLCVVSPDRANFAVNVDTGSGTPTLVISAPRPRNDSNELESRPIGGDIFRILLWSADSRSLLLKNLVSQTIWVGSLSGNVTPVLIPDVPRGVLTAAFSPEAGFITYVDYERTYVIAVDGTRRQALAENGQEGNTFLRYSRDGRRLAFVRVQKLNPYNAGELWLMNSNGSGARKLSLVGSQDFDPVWSYDGRRILFIHRENVDDAAADTDPARLVSNLWVYDLDSQLVRPLTTFRGKRVRHPSISLDDQRINFVSNQTGADEVWTTDLHGGEPYAITNDKATDLFPMWLW